MIVSTTFIYRLLYLILGFSLLALLAVPVVVACQPLEKDARTRLDTRSLDGLRGLAAMHVAIGHYVSFTGLAGRFSDLQAGSSMGLFYLLSGFVMALGYGQKAVRPSHWLRLRQVLLRLLRRGLLLPPFCVSRADAAADAPIFAGRRFLCKRMARMLPVYLLTNLASLPAIMLMLGMAGLGRNEIASAAGFSGTITFTLTSSWVKTRPRRAKLTVNSRTVFA